MNSINKTPDSFNHRDTEYLPLSLLNKFHSLKTASEICIIKGTAFYDKTVDKKLFTVTVGIIFFASSMNHGTYHPKFFQFSNRAILKLYLRLRSILPNRRHVLSRIHDLL